MSPVSKSRIIVLHLTKCSDSSAVVHSVDSSGGRRGYLVRGIGRGKAGTARARSLHPLNILDIVSYESPKSSLSCLREWYPVAQLDSVRGQIVKSSVALFISELIYRSLRDDAYDTDLFEWLCASILRLESLGGSCANFHIWFLAGYCSRLGFRPSGVVEPQGLFTRSQLQLLDRFLHCSVEEAMEIPLNGASRVEFARNMVRYLSYHLGASICLNSFDILHALFEQQTFR